MKPNRDAAALAASLTQAANTPLPLPQQPPISPIQAPMSNPTPEPEVRREAQSRTQVTKKRGNVKVVSETKVISLRPSLELLNRYTRAAAERTMQQGRVVSAQEIMLEVLERGMRAGS